MTITDGTSGDALPTPDEVSRLARGSVQQEVAALREHVRREMIRQVLDQSRETLYIELPHSLRVSGLAYNEVKAELENRGWSVTRDSSPKNESYMVLRRST